MSSSSLAGPVDVSADWVRVPEAAKRLGLKNARSLYRLTQQRVVPFRRLPGTSIIAFAPEDLDEIAALSAVRPLRETA